VADHCNRYAVDILRLQHAGSLHDAQLRLGIQAANNALPLGLMQRQQDDAIW
jgi:hypothetical protein